MRASGLYNEQADFKDAVQFQAQPLRMGNMGHPADNFVGDYEMYNSFEEPTSLNVPVNYYGHGGGTGIKIRTRQTRPSSNNFETQGIAPRRVRLQKSISPASAADNDVRDLKQNHGHDKVQSATAGVWSLDETNLGTLICIHIANCDSICCSVQANEVMEQSSAVDGQEKEYSSSHRAVGTGIKIRSRQPQQPSLNNITSHQGSAPRRIRLQMNTAPRSITDENGEDVKLNNVEGEDESQSTVTEVKSPQPIADINGKAVLQTKEEEEEEDDDELQSTVTEVRIIEQGCETRISSNVISSDFHSFFGKFLPFRTPWKTKTTVTTKMKYGQLRRLR